MDSKVVSFKRMDCQVPSWRCDSSIVCMRIKFKLAVFLPAEFLDFVYILTVPYNTFDCDGFLCCVQYHIESFSVIW